MDSEKFISLIYQHTCLWDQSDSRYRLRDHHRRAWQEISKEMETSVDELKKKWRGLRDTFGKELKKVNNKISGQAAVSETDSKWPYFKTLLFLQGTISRRDLKISVSDNSDISDEEVLTQTSTSSNCMPSSSHCQLSELNNEQTPKKTFKSPLKKKFKRNQPDDIDTRLLQIEEEKLNCIQKSANDPDAQFIMSLLPFLKDVPKHRKLMVRAKLQQVLMDEQNSITSAGLYDNSSDSSQYSVFQQLTDYDITRYVTQFNPNTNY